MDESKRTLTDADVDAIVTRFQEQVKKDFYIDVGKGVWLLAKRGFLIVLLVVAVYGYFGGHVPK